MKKIKKVSLYFFISITAIIIIAVGTAEFTSRPAFCSTCHYMQPFYNSWKASAHNKVSCTKCHFPPGLEGTIRGKLEGLVQVVNYVSGSFARRRPWAEISDASCLQSGCHNTQLLNKDVLYKGVHFNHTAHLTKMVRGKKLRCTSCHSQIVQGAHLVVTETTCFLCHFNEGPKISHTEFKKLSNCTLCHQWNKFSPEEMKHFRFNHTKVVKEKIECKHCHSNVIVGDGAVPKENCYGCHFDTKRLSQYDNTVLIHKVHITEHKVECERCHLTIQHKIRKMNPNSNLACNSCHSDAHIEQQTLFTGKNIDGIQGIPNPMYLKGLHCESCHIFHKQLFNSSSVKFASSKSCESCHGKGYSKLLKIWQQTSTTKLKDFKKDIDLTTLYLKSANKYQKNKSLSYLNNANEIYFLIKRGKAIHNIQYSNDLICRGDSLLNIVMKFLNKKMDFCKNGKEFVPSECSNCHSGIENLTVDYKGMKYSHKVHVVDNHLKCQTCHSNEEKHGQLVYNKSVCNSCHHSEKNQDNCEKCHINEKAIYSGTIFNSSTPDPMFEEDVSCNDCHVPDNIVIKPKPAVCESCHDEEYSTKAKNWINGYENTIEQVFKNLQTVKHRSKKSDNAKIQEIENKLLIIKNNSGNSIHNHKLIMKEIKELQSELETFK